MKPKLAPQLSIGLGMALALGADRLHKYLCIAYQADRVAWNQGFAGGKFLFVGSSYVPQLSALLIGVILAYVILAARLITQPKVLFGVGVFAASVCSNFIDRCLYEGRVADPILVPGLVYTNLADLFQLGALVVLMFLFARQVKQITQNQRVNLWASFESQIKIFFESLMVLGICIAVTSLSVYFTYGEFKSELILVGILTLPLGAFFMAMLANQRVGALKGFERYLRALKADPSAALKLRANDSNIEVERLRVLVDSILEKN